MFGKVSRAKDYACIEVEGSRDRPPLLFFEGHPGIFNDDRESGPWFNVSSEGRCFLEYSVPVTTLGR